MAAQNEKAFRVGVVGGVAGGASPPAAARVKRLNENADVVVLEKGSDVSFSNCGLPYYLSGTVEDSEDLIMMTPAAFRKKHDIDVRVHSKVVSIDLREEDRPRHRAQHGDRRDV
ncbi:MAG: FAD/NAD(P)-binding oxidoreductase [Oscillospiraceae bacterium]